MPLPIKPAKLITPIIHLTAQGNVNVNWETYKLRLAPTPTLPSLHCVFNIEQYQFLIAERFMIAHEPLHRNKNTMAELVSGTCNLCVAFPKRKNRTVRKRDNSKINRKSQYD